MKGGLACDIDSAHALEGAPAWLDLLLEAGHTGVTWHVPCAGAIDFLREPVLPELRIDRKVERVGDFVGHDQCCCWLTLPLRRALSLVVEKLTAALAPRLQRVLGRRLIQLSLYEAWTNLLGRAFPRVSVGL